MNLRRKTYRFIKKNPDVYDLFKHFAKQQVKLKQRFSVKTLTERVRWETGYLNVEDDYKLNNNYTAYIARKLMRDIPKVAAFIETRQVRY